MSDLFNLYEKRERLRRLEHIHGEKSISIVEKEVDTATRYYILPAHSIAIPVCPAAHDLLVSTLVSRSDMESSQVLASYPTISEAHLLLHFREYSRLAYSAVVTVTRPIFPDERRSLERRTRERNKAIAKNRSSHAKLEREQMKEVF